jgi:hypothetical protein
MGWWELRADLIFFKAVGLIINFSECIWCWVRF